jgi:hypothetical protein
MRVPTWLTRFLSPKGAFLQSPPWPFRPTLRVDVYDMREARSGGAPVSIAEVYTNGRTTQFRIESARWDEFLRELFTEPRFLFTSGGTYREVDAHGVEQIVCADGGQDYQPWTKPWVNDVINYQLRNHNLRGELVRLLDGKQLQFPMNYRAGPQ